MACLEHWCIEPTCGWTEFSNTRRDRCPRCGCRVQVMFDEERDHDRDEDHQENQEQLLAKWKNLHPGETPKVT